MMKFLEKLKNKPFLSIIFSAITIALGLGIFNSKPPIPAEDRLKISDTDVVIGMSHGHDEYKRFMSTAIYFSSVPYEHKVRYLDNNSYGQEWLQENYTKEEIKSFGLENY